MNLGKLFQLQKELDERIAIEHGLEDKDLLNNTILASLVELAECANDWRGFKHWSKNKKPKEGLLEEYVDKLHFLLSLGLKKGFDEEMTEIYVEKREGITEQYLHLFYLTSAFQWFQGLGQYQLMFGYFVGLGEMLGFTWGQIEQAYLEKNAENHKRQDTGY